MSASISHAFDGSSSQRQRTSDTPLKLLALCVALGLAALAAYANTLEAPFVLDDKLDITREQAIRPPLSASRIFGTMRPMLTASYALNYSLGGLDVTGYHVFNLAAHILTGIVFFFFSRQLLFEPVFGGRYDRTADAIALIAAALFLLHPIQSESVTYVSQRAEVMASAALLACLWIAARATGPGLAWSHMASLMVLGAIGLFTKEQIAVLPALFVLYDWCFVAAGRVASMRRGWPLYTLLGAIGLIATVRGLLAHAAEPTTGFHLGDISPLRYWTWQPGILLYYARLIAFPDRLCFHCGYGAPWPILRSAIGDGVLVPALILVAGAAAAWSVRERLPLVTFAVFGSALVLAPSAIVPIRDTYMEHRLYLPIGFLSLALVAASHDIVERLVGQGRFRRSRLTTAGVGVAAVVAAILGGLTVQRNEVYTQALSLWRDSVEKAPENHRAQYDLANAYQRTGRFEDAIIHYRESIRLDDRDHQPYVNLGVAYVELERFAEAAEAFEAARQREPDLASVHRNLASAYYRLGRSTDAIAAAQRGVAVDPGNSDGHLLLAELYQAAGRREEALGELDTARRLHRGAAQHRAGPGG